MKTYFLGRTDYNQLFWLLNKVEFATSLAFLVAHKKQENLKVIPKTYSIEVSNDEITIAIILFSGFENEELEELSKKPNVHIITFCKVVTEMLEFATINVKYYDTLSWLFMIIELSENKEIKDLKLLKSFSL